jgi:hypothetical protein
MCVWYFEFCLSWIIEIILIMAFKRIVHLVIMWALAQKIEILIALMVMFGFNINI